MLTVKANDTTLRFPTVWEEVTLGQFTKLVDAGSNTRKILLALCSDPLRLRSLPDATADHQIFDKLTFLNDEPDFFEPRYISDIAIGERRVAVPKDINLECLAQRWELEDWLEEVSEKDEEGKAISTRPDVAALPILAVYLCPYISQEVFNDIEQAKAILPSVESVPVTVALPLAAFFLSRNEQQTPSGKLSFQIHHPAVRPNNRRLQWYLNWIQRRLASIRRWRLSPNGAT